MSFKRLDPEDFLVSSDSIDTKQAEQQAHNDIHQLHTELMDLKIPHVFFNTYNHFQQEQKDWHDSYVEPYNHNMTYYNWSINQGCKPKSGYHFGADAHTHYGKLLTAYLCENRGYNTPAQQV